MKLIKPLLAICLLGLLVWLLQLPSVRQSLLDAADWAEHHRLLAAPLYTLFLMLNTALFLPVWGILMVGGTLFGAVVGIALGWLGYVVGCWLSFLFARTVGRSWVEERFADSARFRRFSNAISEQGFRAVLLTRATLIFPANLINLVSGVSVISQRDYLLATAVGCLPLVILYSVLGAGSANLIQSIRDGSFQPPAFDPWWVLAGAVVLAFALIFLFRRRARKVPG